MDRLPDWQPFEAGTVTIEHPGVVVAACGGKDDDAAPLVLLGPSISAAIFAVVSSSDIAMVSATAGCVAPTWRASVVGNA